MSEVPTGQELLAAFNTAWGSNSRPWSRTWAVVREWSSSVGSHAIPDPQWSSSRSPTGNATASGIPCRRSSASGPIPLRSKMAGVR